MKPEPSIPENGESAFGWKIGTIVLVLAGLTLRLWGLDWDGSAAEPNAVKIINAIASGQLLYQVDPANPHWDHLYFFLAAIFKSILWFVYGGFSVLTGAAPVSAAVDVPTVMAGRLLSTILGTATIWICIRLTDKAFNSKAAGFIAGMLVAVSPLLVAEAHYMDRSAAAVFFAGLCLLPMVDICRGAANRYYGLAGFLLGLAFTVDARLSTLILPLAAAHLIGTFRQEENRVSRLFGLPVVLAAGAFAGVAVGFPPLLSGKVSFIALWQRGLERIAAANPDWTGPWIDGPVGSRLYETITVIGDAVGWVIVILAVLGLAVALYRRCWSGVCLALFALALPLLQIVWLGGQVESCQAMTLPPLLCLAAVGPSMLADRHYRAPAAMGFTAVALALLISIPSMWRTWAVGYLFWQEQPAQSARQWVACNMPPDAQVYADPSAPPLKIIHPKQLKALPDENNKISYVMLSAMDDDLKFRPWTGRAYDEPGAKSLMIRDNFLPLKAFDIKGMPPLANIPGRRRFPRALSPTVLIFANKDREAHPQPLGLEKPPCDASVLRKVCYLNAPEYSRDSTAIQINGRPTELSRTLRAAETLQYATLELVNRGGKAVDVKVSQGPGQRESHQLEPGQHWRWQVRPINWPWPVPLVYPFNIAVDKGFLAGRIISDPLVLGEQALEGGRWADAAEYLDRAMKQAPNALLPRALLAAAHIEQGNDKQVRILLEGREQQLQQLARLALDQSPLDQWLEQMEKFSGLDPVLLMRSLTMDLPVQMHKGHRLGGKMVLNTADINARVSWPQNGQGPQTTIRLKHWLPAAPMVFHCKIIGSPGRQQAGDEPAAHIALYRRDRGKRTKAVEAAITTGQLSGGDIIEVQLRVNPAYAPDWWEIELKSLKAIPLTISHISLGFDPREQLQASARWALTAWGRLALADGKKDLARRILGDVSLIDDRFIHGILPHVQVLRDSGWPGAAAERLRKAVDLIAHRPEMVQVAREMARSLGDEQLGGQLANMMTAIQPPKEHVITFSKGIKLVGYGLESNGNDLGRKVKLRLFWRFEKTPPKDYKINCRLEGPAELKLDHKLLGGKQRMDRVMPGDLIVETVTGRIDQENSSGRYRMVLSLSPDTPGSRRLMVLDGKLAGRRYGVIDGVMLP